MKYELKWIVLLGLLLSGGFAASADESDWLIGERTLPAPAGASEALRNQIAGTPQPDVAERKQSAPLSREQWEALIAARSANPPDLAALSKTLGVSIVSDEVAGVAVHRVMPDKVAPEHAGHLFLYVHGGAYVFGGGDSAPTEGAVIAARAGIPVLSIDYRMPPADPFPAAVEDVVAVYRAVLKDYKAGALAIGGTSAGGGLALASVHRFKALGLAVPGAIYAGTPWADLTKTGDTLFTNEGIDRVLVSYDGSLGAAARLYADGTDLRDPLLSPVYGEFDGFPATYLVTGTRDMFLSDTARTHRKLRAAGVEADLNVYEGLSHAGYAFVTGSPEQQQVYGELADFLVQHLTP